MDFLGGKLDNLLVGLVLGGFVIVVGAYLMQLWQHRQACKENYAALQALITMHRAFEDRQPADDADERQSYEDRNGHRLQ